MEKRLALNEQLVEEMYNWLNHHTRQISKLLYEAFIFGSVARYTLYPNDCDLMLITIADIDTEQWKFLRIQKTELSRAFYEKYNLELSITLVTYDEYNECNGLMTRIRNGHRIFLIL